MSKLESLTPNDSYRAKHKSAYFRIAHTAVSAGEESL